MFKGTKDVPFEDFQELRAWACAWYDKAIEPEFISADYRPDTATLDRLPRYFKAGLSPAEATHACFCDKH
jgi:hypothetical protein